MLGTPSAEDVAMLGSTGECSLSVGDTFCRRRCHAGEYRGVQSQCWRHLLQKTLPCWGVPGSAVSVLATPSASVFVKGSILFFHLFNFQALYMNIYLVVTRLSECK